MDNIIVLDQQVDQDQEIVVMVMVTQHWPQVILLHCTRLIFASGLNINATFIC